MWNYRAVRRKRTWTDPEDQRHRVDYSYAIHEAFYDEKGCVEAITQEPVAVFGEDMEALRHSWVMMAEAFGKPILDYDQIPEPGVERNSSAEGEEVSIPWEEFKKQLDEECGPLDQEAFEREQEEQRLAKEQCHASRFVGQAPLGVLIETILSDYRQWVEAERKRETR
jgi:hypothetical protein